MFWLAGFGRKDLALQVAGAQLLRAPALLRGVPADHRVRRRERRGGDPHERALLRLSGLLAGVSESTRRPVRESQNVCFEIRNRGFS